MEQKISFTFTSESKGNVEFDLPLPVDFTATKGKISKIWFNSSRFDGYKSTWDTYIDNIGIKNNDPDVNPEQEVTEINISGAKNVVVGKTTQLTAVVEPIEAFEKTLAWSSDKNLATVDKDGLVTGVAASANSTDSVTITAAATDGSGVSATWKLLVIPQPVTDITLQGVYHSIYSDAPAGKTFTVTASVSPADAANRALTWSSDKEDIAFVSGNNAGATVTLAGATGRANITATAQDGSGVKGTYILDVGNNAAAAPYTDSYNYVDLLTNAGMNGAITHEGNGALLSYEVNSAQDYRLRFSGSAQSGNRRSIYTFNEPVVFYQKAVVEFDFYSNNHTGGASGDEGQVTFRDAMNNDIFTVYNLNGTTNTLGLAVGALNFSTSNDYNTRKADGLGDQRAQLTETPAAAWYHVKAEVMLVGDLGGEPRVDFTITGITNNSYTKTATLNFPASFATSGGIAKIFFNVTRGSGNFTWDVSVDNIGIKKLDVIEEGQKLTNVTITGEEAVTVIKDKTLQLIAQIEPANAEDPTITWSSTNDTYVTVDEKGVVTGVMLTGDEVVYVKATANDGGGAVGSVRVSVVNQLVTGVTLLGDYHNFYTADPTSVPSFTVKAVVSPSDAFSKVLEWTSNAAITSLSSQVVNGDTATVTVTLVGGTGRDTIRVKATDGSDITAEYYLNISTEYAGYDYVERFNGGSGQMNGTLTFVNAQQASVERYDIYNEEEQMLHFNASAVGGNRQTTLTLNKTISYSKKVIVEFDWFPGDVTGGGAGDEGQISFRSGAAATDDIFTVYNKRSSDDSFNGIGIAVGTLNGTENSRRAYTIDGAFRAHLSDAGVGQWYHIVAEIYSGQRIAFTVTDIPDGGGDPTYKKQVVLPIPTGSTNSSIRNVYFNLTRGGNVSWNTWIDNIGIKVDNTDVPATDGTISGPDNVAQSGGKIILTADVEPWDVSDYTVTWSVDDPTHGTIVPDAVTPWKATLTGGNYDGLMTVTATTSTSGIFFTKNVSVGTVLLTSLEIDGARAADTIPKEVSVNNAITLTATVWPENAGNTSVKWTSDDIAIATVDESTGEVTGKSAGSTVIRATSADGSNLTDTCLVSVVYTNITKVDLQGARRLFYTADPTGTTVSIISVISPATASVTGLTFESLNPDVATVADNGNGTASVTLAGGFGKASIRANTTDGSGVVGYYNIEVAEESPYAVFSDFEAGQIDSTLWGASSDGTANNTVFQESNVRYFTASGSGTRSGTFSLKQQVEGDEIKLRFDWYAGSPVGANDNGINNGLFSVRNAGGFSIITFGFINADNDSIKPLSYFAGEPGSAAYPFSDEEKAKRVNLTGVSNLNAWYTIDLTISYYKMRLDFTITERDNLDNTQTVTNVEIPTESYQANVRSFYTLGRRVGSANIDITSCIDNLGYSSASYNFVQATFDPTGGRFADGTENPKTETVIKDAPFASQVPQGLSKVGYTFTGWAYDEDGQTPLYQPEDILSTDSTLYAQWEIVKLRVVILRYEGGDTISDTYVEYDTRATNPGAPSRMGYTFDKWKNSSTGGDWNFGTIVTTDLTLVATWTAGGSSETYYTVTFVSNNGSQVPLQEVIENGKVDAVTSTRTGYTLDGWYKEAALTNAWNFASDEVTASITLYAKWTPIIYPVAFESNGGGNVAAQQVPYDGKVEEPTPAPTRTGYTLDGWYKEAALTSAWNFAGDVVTGATTLYAKWTAITYTVTFETGNGSAVLPQQVAYDGLVTVPDAPTLDGYNFAGWYKNETFTETWSFAGDKVAGATTLYARWIDESATTYTVTFVSNDGTPVDPQLVVENEKAAQATSTRAGYTFGGWYSNADLTGDAWDFAGNAVTTDITLYAKWTINAYTVTFDTGDGSNVDPQQVEHGGTIDEPTAPTRTGYTFGGWYRNAAFTGAVWNFASDVVTAGITLYAQWTVNTYTVTFVSNEGTNVGSQQVAHGGKVTEPAAPTRTGYTFGGWYSNVELTGAAWSFASDAVTGATTLYAKWTALPATGVEWQPLGAARVYPNPTSGVVTIENDGAEVRLYSLQGTLLKRTYSNQLDLSGYPDGAYLLRTGSKAAKVVKQ
ncbi:MAG: InlB B-repeat-containing protein [Prevotellaceae bacterium]|nr:InlB B-repeat-containing protein [Prevotellaceae bacterium]